MKSFYKVICTVMSILITLSCVLVVPTFAEETKDIATEKNESNQILLTTTTDIFLEKLVSKNAFSVNEFLVNKKNTPDFSSLSRFAIADWACENALITEAQKIEAYCDLLTTRNFENVICLDPFYHAIESYSNTHLLTSNLAQKIDSVLEQDAESQYSTQILNTRSDAGVLTSYGIMIVDETNNVIDTDQFGFLMTYAQGLKYLYMNLGFDFPNFDPSDDAVNYIIAIHLEDGHTVCHTGAVENTQVGNTCMSYTNLYVEVDEDGWITTSDEVIIQRLAHGMFHAIQNIYHTGILTEVHWFREACANWGAWATERRIDGLDLNAFINARQGLKANVGGGSMFFPTTISKYYGGAATIVEIYEQLSTVTTSTYNFNTLRNKINAALTARGYTNVTFADVYIEMRARLVAPVLYYGDVSTSLVYNSNNYLIPISYEPAFDEDTLNETEHTGFKYGAGDDVVDGVLKIDIELAGGEGAIVQYWYDEDDNLQWSVLTPDEDGWIRITISDDSVISFLAIETGMNRGSVDVTVEYEAFPND